MQNEHSQSSYKLVRPSSIYHVELVIPAHDVGVKERLWREILHLS